MKKIIRFSRLFIPAAIISAIIIVAGVAGYFLKDGFYLGVDFQAGLIQEIQFAPTAFRLTYAGPGNASISLGRNSLDIVISGAGVDEITHRFAFTAYPSQADLVRGLRRIEGMGIAEVASSSTRSTWLIQSAQSSPLLEANKPFMLHYIPQNATPILIEDIRSSLLPLGSVSVQVLGTPAERRFMIRMEDKELDLEGSPAERVISTLENTFGEGELAVIRSDYVGSRFSKNLTDQAGVLMGLTLLLMLIYMSFRFKPQYAIGAILGIIHDAIVMVAFVVWTRLEFNITTIAAILTILGYSINNTIVVFDRVRENLRIFPDEAYIDVLDRSLTGTLSRTIITTVTTMVAVLSLYIFTTGSMKDFALALLVGLTSGVYTTTFIASGFAYFWEVKKAQREKRKLSLASSGSKA